MRLELAGPRRILLLAGLGLAGLALVWLVRSAPTPIPVPSVQAVLLDPYDHPLLTRYARYRDALLGQDVPGLQAIAADADDYVAYRAALTLAESRDLEPALRTAAYERALALRFEDPLDKLERRALYLAYGETAEAAGELAAARRAYAEALPSAAAVAGLYRVQDDPYRLANTFLRARRYRDALEALAGRSAPSVEAPALRALGDYAGAQDAYERWLQEAPNHAGARLGLAWTRFYQDDLDGAAALFADLEGDSALYGRALIARRQGDTDGAVALLRRTNDPADLWLATGYLEAEERYKDALPLYLELARGDSVYADDAAYRALVLAERQGDAKNASAARALVPENSFFALKLGAPLELPAPSAQQGLELPARALAEALERAGDADAARGELRFALRAASDPLERLSLAEGLYLLGDYRQSQRAASALLAAGLEDRRVWELAYPQAFALEVGAQASRHGLDPALVWAIMRQESAFYPQALSTSNAQGLMQVIPSTWDWLAELQREAPGNPFDVSTNIRYGAFYLGWLLEYLGGDLELVIASYNRGQGYIKRLFESEHVAFDKDELYREIDALETREYLQRVSLNHAVYRALYPSLSLRP